MIDEGFDAFATSMCKPISDVIAAVAIICVIKVDDFNPLIRFDHISVMQIIVAEAACIIVFDIALQLSQIIEAEAK